MAGYNDTRQLILNALMGRPSGTEVQPQNHQAYALNMLEYLREVELAASGPLVGVADTWTVPIQPENGRICYIAGVNQNTTATYTNFIDEDGNPISFTTGEMSGKIVILIWNTEYWTGYGYDTSILAQSENATYYYSYNIRKTYASVAAMNADVTSPIGTNNKTIKIGDLVTVVNSTTPSENAYYSYEGNLWKLQMGFNFQVEQTRSQSTNLAPSSKLMDDELAKLVSKTGNQTVDGIKTFSSSPIIPNASNDTQAQNKAGVELQITARQESSRSQSTTKSPSSKLMDDEFNNVNSIIKKKSKYPYEDGFLFASQVISGGIDKWLIDAYFDWEFEEGYRYSFSVVYKANLIASLYRHVEGQPPLGNILLLGVYVFTKIPGGKYYRGVLSTKPNDWIIADFDSMSVSTIYNIYYTEGVGLSPRLFKNGNQKPYPLQDFGQSTSQPVSQKKFTDEINRINYNFVQYNPETFEIRNVKVSDISYMHSGGMSIYDGDGTTYSQVVMGTYIAPQGRRILVRKLKTRIYCENTTVSVTAKVYKSKTWHQDPTNNKTLIEEIIFPAGQFKSVKAGFQDVVLSQDHILEADDYLYLYVDGGSTYVVLPKWDRNVLGQPTEPLTAIIFKLGGGGAYYFGSGLTYLSTPLLLYTSDSDITSDVTNLLTEVAEHENRIENLENATPSFVPIDVSLPDKIYAIVGDTLQLFYRGIIKAVNPYNYNIVITCSKGQQFPRYFSYLPTVSDIGTTNFKIAIKDGAGNTLTQKTVSLVTKAAPVAPTTNKNIVCIGDSLTSAGIWCAEADRRLTGTGGTPSGKALSNIKFCGKYMNGTTGYFGYGGWTWYNYIIAGANWYKVTVSGQTTITVGSTYNDSNSILFTVREVNMTGGSGYITVEGSTSPVGTLTKVSGTGDTTITVGTVTPDTANPFWTNGQLDFVDYANTYCNGTIDVIYALLSWNGMSPNKTDFESVKTTIRTFLDKLHTQFPNAKMKIMGVQIPSQNGGMGANYGADAVYSDTYGMTVSTLNMNKAYQDLANEAAYSSWVEFVNVSAQFDSENNMPETDKVVNTRSSKTEKIGTNGVHPATEGYYQIGDAVYRNFVANFCQ